jgi:hypothetical protein
MSALVFEEGFVFADRLTHLLIVEVGAQNIRCFVNKRLHAVILLVDNGASEFRSKDL